MTKQPLLVQAVICLRSNTSTVRSIGIQISDLSGPISPLLCRLEFIAKPAARESGPRSGLELPPANSEDSSDRLYNIENLLPCLDIKVKYAVLDFKCAVLSVNRSLPHILHSTLSTFHNGMGCSIKIFAARQKIAPALQFSLTSNWLGGNSDWSDLIYRAKLTLRLQCRQQ